jgi:uncharacterized repeat protein (TIGR01451 family)
MKIRRISMLLVVAAAAAATALLLPGRAAAAANITTLQPLFIDGDKVTLRAEYVCPSIGGVFFTLQRIPGGANNDSLFNLGHSDVIVQGAGVATEGPFTLEHDADYAVQAHLYGPCGNVDGNIVYFHTNATGGPPADVSVTQSFSSGATAGQPATITITGTNNSKSTPATDAFIKDTMPANFQYIACSIKDSTGKEIGFCAWDGKQTVVGDIGTLAPSQTVTFTIGVRPTQAGAFPNVVGIGAHQWDSDSTNNFVTQTFNVAA